MKGSILGFLIWSAVGCLMIGLGIYAFFVKMPMGFWANAEMFQVTDVKKYNRAVGKLFCAFGVVFVFLGLPMLLAENDAWILLSVLGVAAEAIAAMIIYTTVIERKYKKK